MRILMLIMTAILAFGAVESFVTPAFADPIPESKLDKESRAKAARITKRSPHDDRVESQGKAGRQACDASHAVRDGKSPCEERD